MITRYENENHHTFKSRFDHFGETEKVCIEKLEVAPPFENKGIMTIMFCDIMLALLTRSLANENHIEIKFINTSDLIKDFCNGVVIEGTGVTARPAGYTMGGKTGTAEKVPRGTGNYVVSFMGYVPAEDPQVLIYVVIDEPNVESQDNARYATFLTRDIMTEVLPYLNIYQTQELTEAEIEEMKQKEELAAQSVSENSISGNEVNESVSGNAANQNTEAESDETGDSTQTEEETQSEEKEIQIDPETGYAIDPVTGEFLDPPTGAPIDPTASNLE